MSDRTPRLLSRIDQVFPRTALSASREAALRRMRAWAWPALQIGLAAGLAHLVATALDLDAGLYAPIIAVGALGLGREHRLAPAALMIGGLFVGAVAAEIATPVLGSGWWQVAAMVSITAIATGTLVDRDLAVSYAVLHAIILISLPGSEGLVPGRLLAGVVGAATALVVLLLIMPPRPARMVRRRLRRAVDLGATALRSTADVLRDPGDVGLDGGDARPLITAARRLDDEIERSHEVAAQSREIVRFSPLRRRDRGEVHRLGRIAHELRPALRTASTIARIGDRAALARVVPPDHVIDGLGEACDALQTLLDALLDGRAPDDIHDRAAAEAVDRVMAEPPEHALVIALQEETRGLVADVTEILEREFDSAVPSAHERSVGGVRGTIAYGMVDDGG